VAVDSKKNDIDVAGEETFSLSEPVVGDEMLFCELFLVKQQASLW